MLPNNVVLILRLKLIYVLMGAVLTNVVAAYKKEITDKINLILLIILPIIVRTEANLRVTFNGN